MKSTIFLTTICTLMAFNSNTSAFVKYHHRRILWPKPVFTDQERRKEIKNILDIFKDRYNDIFQNLCEE